MIILSNVGQTLLIGLAVIAIIIVIINVAVIILKQIVIFIRSR